MDYREDLFETLISEKPEIAMKRKKCSETLKALKEAMTELDSLPQELAQQGATTNGKISLLYSLLFYILCLLCIND